MMEAGEINKIISEFMGWPITPGFILKKGNEIEGGKYLFCTRNFDLLLPVLKKIASINSNKKIEIPFTVYDNNEDPKQIIFKLAERVAIIILEMKKKSDNFSSK